MQILDIQSVDNDYKTELLTTHIGGTQSVGLQFFKPTPVAALAGSTPVMPSEYTMGSAHNSRTSKIALDGKAPVQSPLKLNGIDFRFKHKYSDVGGIARVTVEQLAAQKVLSAEELLGLVYQVPLLQIAQDLDSTIKAELLSIPTTEAATAVWSDKTNARPVTDLDKLMFNRVPGADFLWIGHNEFLELAKLPFILAEIHNFDATDATADKSQLAAWLRRRYELADVLIGGGWYNENAPPMTFSKKRRFDGMIVAGMKDHVAVSEFSAMRESWEKYDDTDQTYKAGLHVWIDVNKSSEPDALAQLTGF